jgi:hypothetical protein
MSFCTITPDRNDRPEFTEFCKHQLSRMSVKPDHSYFIDYAPVSKGVDLIERFEKGVAQAKADGFDEVFVIENDDYYPVDYFERMQLDKYDIIGIPFSHYYHLGNRRHQLMNHPKWSSLYCTGFKMKVLNNFDYKCKHLDVSIWQHIRANSRSRKHVYDILPVGIKHGIGLCGGIGHTMKLKNEDKDMSWLKSNVDSEAWTFYNTLKLISRHG